MSEFRWAFIHVTVLALIWLLTAVAVELHLIAKSLKVLASPPQIEESNK